MPVNIEAYKKIKAELDSKNVTLVAVSKTKPVEDILELYHLGQRDFGENYVQELVDKAAQLPKDIRWHFIGHLQSNKVKLIAPFIHLIHGVDSLKLLQEIDKQGSKCNRVMDVLLQVHIAQEETKFGFDEEELKKCADIRMANVRICGLMGMASFTNDTEKVRAEFKLLKSLFDKFSIPACANAPADKPHSSLLPTLTLLQASSILSMGMSSDYKTAIEEGSNMVRIGSLIFGARN